jgi:hypothetical protein
VDIQLRTVGPEFVDEQLCEAAQLLLVPSSGDGSGKETPPIRRQQQRPAGTATSTGSVARSSAATLAKSSAGRRSIMASVDPTVSTLIGVFLGGGIASGTSFRLESLRARREEQAATKREEREARRAARLLAEELEYGRRLLATALEKDYYTWEPPRSIPSTAWTEYRADFCADCVGPAVGHGRRGVR